MNSVFDRLLRGDLRLEGCYDGSPWRSVSDSAKDLVAQVGVGVGVGLGLGVGVGVDVSVPYLTGHDPTLCAQAMTLPYAHRP